MLDSFKKALTAVKEGALEAGARAYLNREFEKYGAVTNLRIDSQRRTIVIEAALKGESSPLEVSVGGYELQDDRGSCLIILRDFAASRGWVAAILNEFVAGRPLRIPASLRMVL
jgi:hypothetical protein